MDVLSWVHIKQTKILDFVSIWAIVYSSDSYYKGSSIYLHHFALSKSRSQITRTVGYQLTPTWKTVTA